MLMLVIVAENVLVPTDPGDVIVSVYPVTGAVRVDNTGVQETVTNPCGAAEATAIVDAVSGAVSNGVTVTGALYVVPAVPTVPTL